MKLDQRTRERRIAAAYDFRFKQLEIVGEEVARVRQDISSMMDNLREADKLLKRYEASIAKANAEMVKVAADAAKVQEDREQIGIDASNLAEERAALKADRAAFEEAKAKAEIDATVPAPDAPTVEVPEVIDAPVPQNEPPRDMGGCLPTAESFAAKEETP